VKQSFLKENKHLVSLLQKASLGDLSLRLDNFHAGFLLSVLDLVSSPVVVFAETDLLFYVRDRLCLSWKRNGGLFLPPTLHRDGGSLSGFFSQDEKTMASSLALIRSFPKDLRILLTTSSVYDLPLIAPPSSEPFLVKKHTSFDEFISWIRKAGYERVGVVTLENTFATRGGIVDVFPCGASLPVRLNFLDDEISMHFFDIDSQITASPVHEFSIPSLRQASALFSVSKFLSNNLLKVTVLNKRSVLIGDTNKARFSYSFPYKKVSHNNFFNIKKNDPKVSYYKSSSLCSVGISDGHSYIIPGWFVDTPFVKKPQLNQNFSFLKLDTIEWGDFVVHQHHGIGRCVGVYETEISGTRQEFLEIEFDDFAKISVSVDRLDLLSFYASSDEMGVGLDSLARPGLWKKRRLQAKKSAEDFVEDVLNSYASRSVATKTPFSGDKELEGLFIKDFPFIETSDQKRTWKEISDDLACATPMNRLLCGDVGFGKTELALRSAFRVVCSGKQVLVLAPTTVLASQLYASFRSRFDAFSVSVGLVSRFKASSVRRKIMSDFSNNNIDVLIGTHSLLYGDISFNNTGLLVIDEEHRFGVKQKDKFPTLLPAVDILSMSATPIPRTMHLAISGIRNISTLSSPPLARKPISTTVAYYDKLLILKAIKYETVRGGQVFFVHNNVASIDFETQRLCKLFPNLAITSAHGQESSAKLEKTMGQFFGGEVDVLVCSSIIESGLDVPNANTIIINRAHLLGLSQLYQIRGRVGRSSRQAYAYLLVPPSLRLNNKAFKRLKAIEQNTSLGSGYDVSMMDLEIRGAGSLFGYKQSGGVARVGAELYSRFVKEALNRSSMHYNGTVSLTVDDINVSLFLDNTIPVEYIRIDNLRLSFYRKLAVAENQADLNLIEFELENRFGKIPDSVKNLLFSSRVKVVFLETGVSGAFLKNSDLHIVFEKDKIRFDFEFCVTKMNLLFEELGQKHWFKRIGNQQINLVVADILRKDISTIMSYILDKLLALKQGI